MTVYQLLFLFKNLFDQLLMIIAEIIDILSVLCFEFCLSLHFCIEGQDFDILYYLLWLLESLRL